MGALFYTYFLAKYSSLLFLWNQLRWRFLALLTRENFIQAIINKSWCRYCLSSKSIGIRFIFPNLVWDSKSNSLILISIYRFARFETWIQQIISVPAVQKNSCLTTTSGHLYICTYTCDLTFRQPWRKSQQRPGWGNKSQQELASLVSCIAIIDKDIVMLLAST